MLVATGTPGVYTVEGLRTRMPSTGRTPLRFRRQDKGGSSVPLTPTASTVTVADGVVELGGAFTFTATEGQASGGAAGGHADRRGRG